MFQTNWIGNLFYEYRQHNGVACRPMSACRPILWVYAHLHTHIHAQFFCTYRATRTKLMSVSLRNQWRGQFAVSHCMVGFGGTFSQG